MKKRLMIALLGLLATSGLVNSLSNAMAQNTYSQSNYSTQQYTDPNNPSQVITQTTHTQETTTTTSVAPAPDPALMRPLDARDISRAEGN